MRYTGRIVLTTLLLTSLAIPASPLHRAPQRATPESPDFTREVRPILAGNCFACHGPDESSREAGLRLDTIEGALALRSSRPAIEVGDAAASLMMERIRSDDDAQLMPPAHSGFELDSREIEVLAAWIESGAKYEPHWSFVAPQQAALPEVADPGWVRRELDYFLLAALESGGLQPAQEADRATLLRRLSLDLIGLPPTPAELAHFVESQHEDAYGRVVERLLASPHFGERWASVWLDMARYADSSGYGSDPLRDIWRYRDWVIEALNEGMPFDEFTIQQLAGDLLPDADVNTRLATAFHRNTMTNTEGGTDDEEFRVAAIKDRVNTSMQVWMGLTMGCAQCHSHKFDPISHREYYQVFAIFNQTEDADRGDDSPRLATPTRAQREQRADLEVQIADARGRLQDMSQDRLADQVAWEAQALQSWQAIAWQAVSSKAGTQLETQPNGLLVALGDSPETDTYILEGVVHGQAASALALDVLADESLPSGGPGRSPGNGNFVLNDLRVTIPRAEGATSPHASRVRISMPGEGRILSLAEVEIWSDDENVARVGVAAQSSVGYEGPASLAIDGNTSGVYDEQSVTHTATEANPWWEVRFDQPVRIDRIRIFNRTDGNLEERLDDFSITAYDSTDVALWGTWVALPPNPSVDIALAQYEPRALLSDATASFEQDGWPITNAIDSDDGSSSGWAIGPKQGSDHYASFKLHVPEGALQRSGGRIRLTLVQSHGGQHTIGRLRARTSLSADAGALSAQAAELLRIARELRTDEQQQELDQAWRAQSPLLAGEREVLAMLEGSLAAVPNPTTPVMVELPEGRRRTTHVLEKGNFLIPLEPVEAAVPAAFHRPAADVPLDRLAFARWLISEQNPLTARVAVNRFWARIFGTGLVDTEEDFGTQGEPPVHPELLDHLSLAFIASGWDTKALLRSIVSSATYRQSSRHRSPEQELDPQNRLHWRGPRTRLSAEQLRDQALALSGLLSDKMFGPSVFPPQPPDLWRAAFNGQRDWATSQGEDRYRRALYTFHRRTIPYPSMSTFDAPSRELCTPRRIRTNTPLQAFVTLNDPVFIEAARALANRVRVEGGTDTRERLKYALEVCTCRPASDLSIRRLESLLDQERLHWAETPADAATFLEVEISEMMTEFELVESAAWTVVANVLLNLDAVLVKD
ncbi:MAG: hypothetical protein ACI835_002495 [Planctomycetota bacterium]